MDKESNTVWRLTTEDFRGVMEDRYPLLTDNEVEMIIAIALNKFNIEDWVDYVDVFISLHADEVKEDSE